MNNLVWLASYPKSGNTWVRLFLSCLLSPKKTIDINDIESTPIPSSSHFLEKVLGLEIDCLTTNEIRSLLPSAIRHHAKNAPYPTFHKIHDARLPNENGEVIALAECSRTIVYILRNPLDVCVSLAHFRGTADFAAVAKSMANEQANIATPLHQYPNQFPQPIGSWSTHVRSWSDTSRVPTFIFRYEDLLANPIPEFTRLVRSLDLKYDAAQIQSAVQASSFTKLHLLEEAQGFAEKPKAAQKFFRSGKSGDWQRELPEDVAKTIIAAHRETMHRFGYLDDMGNLAI